MDCAARKKLIKEATTYPQVEKVLQEAHISRSGMELARTAYQIREAQPKLSEHFLDTVIREMEDHEKKVQEYEGGQSEQASNRADPLPNEIKNKTSDGGNPSTQATGTEDQMREDIMSMMDPSIAQQMMPHNMPPMTLPQQIKQMQYTVKRMLGPIIKEVQTLRAENKQLKEAISAMDTKIRETQQRNSIALEISPKGNSKIKETTQSFRLPIPVNYQSLEDARNEIADLNRMMNNGELPLSELA